MGRKRVQINKDEIYGRLKTTGNFIKKGHNVLWECRCECNKTIYVSSHDLKSGHTKSCGRCLDKAYKTGLNYLYGIYRRGAIERNLSFNISKEQFNKIIKLNCYYCNSAPSQILYKEGMQLPFTYNGIDRKNNAIGYEINNIVPACKFCNMAKGTSTLEEFEKWINRLIEYRTKGNGNEGIANNNCR